MQRRGFLGAMLAAAAAPAFVRAGSLMRVNPAIIATPAGILTADVITREALRVLHGNLRFMTNMNREYLVRASNNLARQIEADIYANAVGTVRIGLPAAYKRKVRGYWQ